MLTVKHYDTIVVGTGGVGSAALYHLAQRGQNVLGIDRFSAAHDRGSSHGKTRIIRKAYFEHPDYVPLLHRAYELWEELASVRNEQLFHRCGLLQVGPADGMVIQGILASSRRFNLEIQDLSRDDVAQRMKPFRVPDGYRSLFDPEAGFLMVEQCVLAHLELATKHGAKLRPNSTVIGWSANSKGATVELGDERIECERLVLTAGPWTSQLLTSLADKLVVRRKPLYWYETNDDAWCVDRGCPTFFYEVPEGVFYGFPRIDGRGMKLAMHSGGPTVDDPMNVSREIDKSDRQRVEQFITRYLHNVSAQMTDHATCMYTMTDDEHFVVDHHPQYPHVVFAAGLSGHGFKFTGVLGQALADLCCEGSTSLPIEFLSLKRWG